MAVEEIEESADPQSDAVWILSSTFITVTMQSGKSEIKNIFLIICFSKQHHFFSVSMFP